MRTLHKTVFSHDDGRWFAAWCCGMLLLFVWDSLFLNAPARRLVQEGFFNTFYLAFLVVGFTLVVGWSYTMALHGAQSRGAFVAYYGLTFILNLIRSIPQVIGVLFGYVLVVALLKAGMVHSTPVVFILIAGIMSLFIVPEMVDLLRERIDYFKKLDFYPAMQVLGIGEMRIVNFDILWKNSRIHVFNKLISILGFAVFLQCSVDFIVSIGLSLEVNAVSLPVTLGNLLANIDSKQDILAVGYTLTHPFYFPRLFVQHLQGISVAVALVFTLMSIFHIANGFAERHKV